MCRGVSPSLPCCKASPVPQLWCRLSSHDGTTSWLSAWDLHEGRTHDPLATWFVEWYLEWYGYWVYLDEEGTWTRYGVRLISQFQISCLDTLKIRMFSNYIHCTSAKNLYCRWCHWVKNKPWEHQDLGLQLPWLSLTYYLPQWNEGSGHG